MQHNMAWAFWSFETVLLENPQITCNFIIGRGIAIVVNRTNSTTPPPPISRSPIRCSITTYPLSLLVSLAFCFVFNAIGLEHFDLLRLSYWKIPRSKGNVMKGRGKASCQPHQFHNSNPPLPPPHPPMTHVQHSLLVSLACCFVSVQYGLSTLIFCGCPTEKSVDQIRKCEERP